MHVVIVGASGNSGTALLRRLADEPEVTSITAIARRVPPDVEPYGAARWVPMDVGADCDLTSVFEGADAVVHLAWQIQPSQQPKLMQRTNVHGTRRVAEAAARAGVPTLVVASSAGAYEPGPRNRRVGEGWPVGGVPGSLYSQQKAVAERILDDVEKSNPHLRVVRLRPGLVFQYAAGGQMARFFLGPWAPVSLLRNRRLPVVPLPPRLRVQCVHAADLAEAYANALLGEVRGAFNIVAEPVLDPPTIARLLRGRAVPVPPGFLAWAAGATWLTRLQPTDPGWIWLATRAPLLDATQARVELGWSPRYDATTAFTELVEGIATGAGTDSPALRPRAPLTDRIVAAARGRLPGAAARS